LRQGMRIVSSSSGVSNGSMLFDGKAIAATSDLTSVGITAPAARLPPKVLWRAG
jgi:hypothetical protein